MAFPHPQLTFPLIMSTPFTFRHFNHLPRCQTWIDTTFQVYALNYAHAGRIRWAMDGGDLRTLEAPVCWWT